MPFAPSTIISRVLWSLLPVVLLVSVGCGGAARNVEIDNWVSKTRLRNSGIPVEGASRTWKPLDLINYKLGAGDVITIRVLGHPDLSVEQLKIPQGGTFPFSFIGNVAAKGLPANSLARAMSKALEPYIDQPKVLVTVDEYSRHYISVLGSVQNPGKYPIESDSRLLDALVSAGGITLGGRTGGPAAAREMFVYRKIPADRRLDNMPIDPAYVSTLSNMSEEEREEGLRVLKEQGQYETISIPVSDAVSLGRFKYNILLQPDDIIYIPPAGSVIVRGWVNRPTLVSLGPSVHTLSHVLTLAGGLRFGGSSNVKVLRRSGDGEEITQIEVNARDMIALKLTDIPLRDGDEVYVPSQWFRATLEWFGGILNKGTNIGASATYNPI